MYKNINELEEKINISSSDTMVIETKESSKKSSLDFFKQDHTEEIFYIEADDLIVLDTEKGQKKIKYKNFKTHSCLDFNKIGEINLNGNYHLVNQDLKITKLLSLINSFATSNDISNNNYNDLNTSNKNIINAINEVYDLINNKPPIEPPYIEVETFELGISTLELEVNSSYTFNPTILPTNATDKTITWQINSNNDQRNTIADMNGNIINGISVGTCTVIAMCGSKISTCIVNVIDSYKPITKITVNPSTYLLSKGQTGTLSAGTVPINSTNEKIWECSNTSLVTIEPSGSRCYITGLAQKGTVSVTVTCDGLSATCTITLSK